MHNFLQIAINELLVYYTPDEIIDYINGNQLEAIIANPPYNTNECNK